MLFLLFFSFSVRFWKNNAIIIYYYYFFFLKDLKVTSKHLNQSCLHMWAWLIEEKVSNSFWDNEMQRLTMYHLVKYNGHAPPIVLFSLNKNLSNKNHWFLISRLNSQSHTDGGLQSISWAAVLSLVCSSKTASCPLTPTGTNLFITPWILAPLPQVWRQELLLHN